MNAIRTLALAITLFAAQSAMAGTYDFLTMGPPETKTIIASSDSLYGDFDTFNFSINALSNISVFIPDVPTTNLTRVQVWSIRLFDSSDNLIGSDIFPSTYSFDNLAAGAYKFIVTTYGNTNYNVTLTTEAVAASAATAVPEPEAYAMMLAGLGLVGFVARRKQS